MTMKVVIMSQCTCRCVVLPDLDVRPDDAALWERLNAPAGAWCSLTGAAQVALHLHDEVSMHLQVRGAP